RHAFAFRSLRATRATRRLSRTRCPVWPGSSSVSRTTSSPRSTRANPRHTDSRRRSAMNGSRSISSTRAAASAARARRARPPNHSPTRANSPPYFGDEKAAPGRDATTARRMGPGAVPLLPAHGHGRRGLGGKAGSRRALREALRRTERAVHVHHHAGRDAGGLRAHLFLHRPPAAPHHAP